MAPFQSPFCASKANRAFSVCNTDQARPGQIRVPGLRELRGLCYLVEAKYNSCVARAWRLHLIVHGVVTPDHS